MSRTPGDDDRRFERLPAPRCFIVGPPLIGLLADRIGLPKTLGLLVVAALAVAALAGRASVSTPTMGSPDGELPTSVPEREAAIQ